MTTHEEQLKRLQEANAELRGRDRDLVPEAREISKSPELESLRGGRGGPEKELVAETIVRRTGRPALKVLGGAVDLANPDAMKWREHLKRVAKKLQPAIAAVGRIDTKNHDLDWVGTGWLVAPNVIVTNRHVASEFAHAQRGEFVFRQGPFGKMSASVDFFHEHQRQESAVFELTEVLHIQPDDGWDVALIRVQQPKDRTPIKLQLAAARADHLVATIGYPASDSRIPEPDLMRRTFDGIYDVKRFAPGRVIRTEDQLVLHDCSTLGGNSGSVVLDLDSGAAVALHFSGRFLEANYAVPAVVVDSLLRGLERKPPPRTPLQPIPAPSPAPLSTSTRTTRRTFTLPIRIDVDVDVGTPAEGEPGRLVQVQAERDDDAGGDDESELVVEGRPEDYDDREGYVESFLGPKVPLPTVRLKSDARPLLKYEHFSVVMSKKRRLCWFSAVNIDGKTSGHGLRRSWRWDSRIPKEAQVRYECYGEAPKFSRGHMTRREDPIWGSARSKERGNTDSMHVTNTVPQLQEFNAPIWLKLEDYALENARKDDMKISVFTGPFFAEKDPERDGVLIPLSFWKVIAFVHDKTGKLCATGYTVSQEKHVSGQEFVYGQFEQYQVPLKDIERRAGVSFGTLTKFDALAKVEEARPRPLQRLDQIRFLP